MLAPGSEGVKLPVSDDSLVPMKRMGRAEEMDGLITLLASEGASYITGQAIAIDGGLTSI